MNMIYEEDYIQAIADAIRSKNGKEDEYYKVSEMANAINVLNVGDQLPTGSMDIFENGTYDVTSYATAEVNVPIGIFPEGTKQITSNGEVDVTTFEKVNVNVETGGSEFELPPTTEMGFFIPTENIYDTNPVTINHSLGVKPKCVLIMMLDISGITSAAMLIGSSTMSQGTVTKAGGTVTYAAGTYVVGVTDTSFNVVGKSNTPFLAGKKYMWFAFS